MSTSKLPNKLSALIRMALIDLGKVERSKRYTVNMQVWHQPCGELCAVCLAGAVIAKELGVSPEVSVDPLEYSHEIKSKLFALESVRTGQIEDAVTELTHPVYFKDAVEGCGEPPTFPSYRKDKRRFKRGLRKLATWLERNGL